MVRSSEHSKNNSHAAQRHFWPVSDPFWVRLGVRARVRVRVGDWGCVGSTCVP